MEEKLLFGAAYYEEYLPYDRLEEDMELMTQAGLNVIRIAESTWSVLEPRPGEYDFSHIDRVLEAAGRHGLQVIVGTPTYAVPHWLVQLDPTVLAETKSGPGHYGVRQNMDITNPTYLEYARRMILALVEHTANCPQVIGYQIDNETKHYHTSGPRVQERFRQWLEKRFHTVETLNQAYGFAYWSNSVTCFQDLPDPNWTINGSYGCAFEEFQRELAADFLCWQGELVSSRKRPDQFITQNFDYEWHPFAGPGRQEGYSWGVQPDINHYDAAKAVTLVGTDIYCFAQDRLTGAEIAFGGDLMRSLKRQNYLVLESQAQAFKEWLPYPGQLRLMAYSHLASGACGVMYWHWFSIHNSMESYWRGILSHDFAPNPTYEEVKRIGQEWKTLAPHLTGLKKRSRIALVVSAEALHALRWFPTDPQVSYNDIVHWVYDSLYELNLECDVIYDRETNWSGYDLLLFPALYCASEELIAQVREFIGNGGTVFATFRSFVADENVKIYHDPQPHRLTDCFGMTYNQFTRPEQVTVDGAPAHAWMELLTPLGGEVQAHYGHKYWGQYAALTRNDFGKGHAWYLGTMVPKEQLKDYLCRAAQDAGIAPPSLRWPLIHRQGTNSQGHRLHFLLHYSSEPTHFISPWQGTDLLTGRLYFPGDQIELKDWDVCVLEES